MDADRFDTLARALSAPRSRRAALSSAAAGGLLSALGLTRAVPETRAAQGGLCVVAFAATTGRTGEVRGNLSFSLAGSGNLDNAALTLPDGAQLPVVGQATGHSLQLRIALGPQQALVAVGVGEQEISRCQGAIDGVATGSQSGDLGDWHATAGVQNIPSGGQGSAGATQSTAAGAGGAAAAAGSTGQTGRAGNTSRGTTGSGAAGPGAGSTGPACPSGETYCAYVEECRDLRTSSLDCGACGTRCPSLVCQAGRCLSEDEADRVGALKLQCVEGMDFCDLEEGYCADLSQDSLNCGACGFACPANAPLCFGGNCYVQGQDNCPEGLQRCGETCVSFFDETNCGGCGIFCSPGTTCQGGVCAQPGGGACPSGTVDCGSDPPLCVDTLTNPSYCGLCSISCAPGEICQGGACIVAGGGGCKDGNLTFCAGVCVALTTDPANCGSCGFVCGEGTTCQGSVCVAAEGAGAPPAPDGQLQTCDAQGLMECAGICVDINTDNANCGECGAACAEGTVCQVGGCVGTIP